MGYKSETPICRITGKCGRYDFDWRLSSYSGRSYISAEYWIHFMARFGVVHAFGYNSAENEPIWMKSGEL